MTTATFSIRDLSEEFGITPRAIRFYEDKGLLHPYRQGQTRIYNVRDRARLILVLRGKRVGFSLDELREMLDLYDLQDGQISQLRVSLDKHRQRIEDLEQQKKDIDESLAELKNGCALLEKKLAEKSAAEDDAQTLAQTAAGYAGPLSAMVRTDDHL